jgi:hypothetical protein
VTAPWLRAVSIATSFALPIGACASAPGTTALPPPDGPVLYRIPERPVCASASYTAPTDAGGLGDADLLEASGLVASPSHANVLWSHNDSGDDARVFALATDGTALGRVALPDVEAKDIEDIAAAPCPDLQGPCLYLADTGNNALERDRLFVYAIREPDVEVDEPIPAGTVASQVWTFPIAMPDPPVNVEAMVITPGATEMIFFEKIEDTEARILAYRAPWTPDVEAALEVTDTFDPPGVDIDGGHLVTGADMHPSGKRIALRTYTGAWEVLLDLHEGAPLDHVESSQVIEMFLGPLSEPQGEAIAYDSAGTGVWTVSESPDGSQPQLHHAACQD